MFTFAELAKVAEYFWDEEAHPRWPALSPDSKGGQFRPKTSADYGPITPRPTKPVETTHTVPAQERLPAFEVVKEVIPGEMDNDPYGTDGLWARQNVKMVTAETMVRPAPATMIATRRMFETDTESADHDVAERVQFPLLISRSLKSGETLLVRIEEPGAKPVTYTGPSVQRGNLFSAMLEQGGTNGSLDIKAFEQGAVPDELREFMAGSAMLVGAATPQFAHVIAYGRDIVPSGVRLKVWPWEDDVGAPEKQRHRSVRQELYGQLQRALPAERYDAIQDAVLRYEESSSPINDHFRGRRTRGFKVTAEALRQGARDAAVLEQVFDDGLVGIRVASAPLVLYRGVRGDLASRLVKGRKGEVFNDSAFMSFSTSVDTAESFGTTKLRLTIPRGAVLRALPSVRSAEEEFILDYAYGYRLVGRNAAGDEIFVELVDLRGPAPRRRRRR